MKAFNFLEEYLEEHYPNRAERLADWWVHAVGLLAAIGGGIALLVYCLVNGHPALIAATMLYAVCLIAMLAISAAYNFSRIGPHRPFLRRMDEAAIFLMIAGSYTPFTTQRLEGAWAVTMTLLVWAIAIFGVFGKLFLTHISERAWTMVYVAFGWLAVIAMRPLIEGVAMISLILLVIGGLLYTMGALLFLRPTLPYRRAVWHTCVVTAAAAHYAAIFVGVAVAGASA